jgi:hypothetical protein
MGNVELEQTSYVGFVSGKFVDVPKILGHGSPAPYFMFLQ